jgi:hypothetical protein
MTTLMIDDALGQQARQAAAAQGKTLDEFVREALERAVGQPTVRHAVRSGLPVVEISPAIPIDAHLIQRTLAEEGF